MTRGKVYLKPVPILFTALILWEFSRQAGRKEYSGTVRTASQGTGHGRMPGSENGKSFNANSYGGRGGNESAEGCG